MTGLLPPDRWRHVTTTLWRSRWAHFLGDDQPAPAAVGRILTGGTYQPDTFTIADRFTQPAWLDPHERHGETWLRDLVARRAAALGPLPPAATGHVYDQLRRLLELPHGPGPAAAAIYNQEAGALVDRVAAWCLHRIPHGPVDTAAPFNRAGRAFVADLLGHVADQLDTINTSLLLHAAVAAGLIGLDLKGGPAPYQPLPLHGWQPGPATGQLWRTLLDHARRPAAVDHTPQLLADIAGPVRLVWWLDDLIETALDLLVIQRLVTVNPALDVLVVPKNGRYDNDASASDVARMLRHPTLRRLRRTVSAGRVRINRHGPRMPTANPLRLHTRLVAALPSADLMFCKGGRIHEMFNGNLTLPTYTGYVLAREFTQAQAGYDPTTAPVLIFRADAGEWPWWGFRGRTTSRRLPTGQSVRACHSTIAEHHHRATTTDTDWLASDLARLQRLQPTLPAAYAAPARTEVTHTRTRLARFAHTLPAEHRNLLNCADTLAATGGAA